MKKLMLLVVLLLVPFGLDGCATLGQSALETAQMKQEIDAGSLAIKGIWDDPGIPQAEKLKMTAAIISQLGQKAELIKPEEGPSFEASIAGIVDAWYAAQGVIGGQMNPVSITSLIVIGLMLFRNLTKKKREQ